MFGGAKDAFDAQQDFLHPNAYGNALASGSHSKLDFDPAVSP